MLKFRTSWHGQEPCCRHLKSSGPAWRDLQRTCRKPFLKRHRSRMERSWVAWMKRSEIRETIPSTPPGFRAFGLDPGYGTWRNTCQWCQAASTLRTKSKEARAAPFRDLSGIHPKGPKVGLTTCLGPSAGCWPLSAQGSQSGPSCRL